MAMTDHTIRYFSSTTDRPLSCDVCGQLISRDGFLHQRRTLSINVLILVTEGTLYLTANGIPYTVPPNHYIFLHEGEEHFGHRASTGGLSYFWVHFFAAPPFRAVADTFSCQDSAYFFPEYGKLVSPGRILSLFRRLTDLSLDECKNAPRMLDYTTSLLLMELSSTPQSSDKKISSGIPAVIPAACDWIHANYCRSFFVEELADAVGYQADYLSSLFKRHMGLSLVSYTNRLRIEASTHFPPSGWWLHRLDFLHILTALESVVRKEFLFLYFSFSSFSLPLLCNDCRLYICPVHGGTIGE